MGDVVHIHEDSPRGTWQLAKVVELFKSNDKLIRSAKVVLPNGKYLNRSLQHLYPLECNDNQNIDEILNFNTNDAKLSSENIMAKTLIQISPTKAESPAIENSAEPNRPKRKSAIAALDKIKQQMLFEEKVVKP